MALLTTVSGRLVGATVKPYDFTEANGERKAGESRRLYLSPGMGEAPTEISVSAKDYAMFEEIAALEFGASLVCVCAAFANAKGGGRAEISCVLTSYEVASSNGVKRREPLTAR
jgi:hypothetical protein